MVKFNITNGKDKFWTHLWSSHSDWSLSCRQSDRETDICIWTAFAGLWCRVVSRRAIYRRASVSAIRDISGRVMDCGRWSTSSVTLPRIAHSFYVCSSCASVCSLTLTMAADSSDASAEQIICNSPGENTAAAHVPGTGVSPSSDAAEPCLQSRGPSHVSMRQRVCQRADASMEYWLVNDVLHYYTLQ